MSFRDTGGGAMGGPPGSGPKVQLWAGQPVFAGAVMGIFGSVGLAMILFGAIPALFNSSSELGAALGLAGILTILAIVIALVGVPYAIAALGTRRWLEGTVHVSKHGWTTTTVDLSRVEVGLSSLPLVERSKYAATTLGRGPVLMCRADGQDWVAIPLTVGGGNIMPRSHLLAIADAVVAGRPASPQAEEVASHIRRLADTPLGRGTLPPDWPGSDT